MALSPDGKRLLVAGPDVVLWDLEKRKRVMNLGRPGVLRVDLARSGRYAAAGCADGTVRVWDLESGKEVRALKGHTERVMEIRFFPEGNRIASASVDGTVRISDFLGEKVTVLKGDGSPLYAVDVSSDGALVDGGGGISVTNLMARFTSGTARQGG